MRPELLVVAMGLAVASFAYIYVGRVFHRRRRGANLSGVHGAFGPWWYGVGGALAAATAGLFAAGFEVRAWGVYALFAEGFVVGNAAAIGGMAANLLYLYSGRPRVARAGWAFAVVYGAGYTVLLALLARGGLAATGDSPLLDAAIALGPGATVALVGAFYLPHAMAAFAYAALVVEARDPAARRRVLLLAVSVLASAAAFIFVAVAEAVGRRDVAVLALGLAAVSPAGVLFANFRRPSTRRLQPPAEDIPVADP